MTLLNAPAYNERRERMVQTLLIALGGLFSLLLVLTFAGFISGHGWLSSNLYTEHRINRFLTDIEQKNFDDAYAIYVNDSSWKQHPEKHHEYPLKRFTEDWTTYSPVGAIHTHHVDKSVADGSGPFGTTLIVASTINGQKDKRLFLAVQRSDGTLSYPSPHIFEY